jgi:hypothetical protein
MTRDIPEVFSEIIEVDETYLGGQMKNKRKEIKLKLGKNRKGFGTIKQPVFGILCRKGKVYSAEDGLPPAFYLHKNLVHSGRLNKYHPCNT